MGLHFQYGQRNSYQTDPLQYNNSTLDKIL